MPFMSQVAMGSKPIFTIFGGDYGTLDGTGEICLKRFYKLKCSVFGNTVQIVIYIVKLKISEKLHILSVNTSRGTNQTHIR